MSPSRRQVLATCGVALTAGCSSVPSFSDDDGDDQSTPEAPAPFLHEPTDWPQPNYDAANTNAAPAAAAPDGSLGQAWSTAFDGDDVVRRATPVVADGQVYLTQVVEAGNRLPVRLLALDARTGEERWRFQQGEDAAYAGPQATVAGETVFLDGVDGEETTLYALNAADGQVLWSERLDLRQTRTAVPAHGLVYVSEPLVDSDESRFAALDARTGERQWVRDVAGSIPWMATVGPEDVYYGQFAGDGEDHLLAFDARSGEPRWGSTQPTQETIPFHDGRLYTVAEIGEDEEGPRWRLDAFDVDRRESVWSVERDLGTGDESERNRGEFTVGAVTDDVVLTGVGFYGVDPDHVVAYDTATGDQQWEFMGDDEGGGDVYSTPTVAGDRLYLTHTRWGREGASLRVFGLASGERQATYDLPPDAVGKPVVAGGRLYVQTESGIVAYESE